MARGPGHRPLIVLRWIFLGLLLAAVAVVVYLYRQAGNEPKPPRTAGRNSTLAEVEDGEVVLAAEGFEYEVIEEGETLFLIRAERMVSDRNNRLVLEGVELSMAQEEGEPYLVESRRAEYDLESRDARLEGAVRLRGPDGVELASEGFTVERRGHVLTSTEAPATFLFGGGYSGSAEVVRINLQRNNLMLRGEVEIRSPPGTDPPMTMSAARMLYRESEGALRAEGDVRFEHGSGWLTSRRLSVGFATREGRILGVRFVHANWDVVGSMPLADQGDRARLLAFAADKLSVELGADDERIQRVVLEEKAPRDARLEVDSGAGLRQTVSSRVIQAGFDAGALARVETFAPTVFEEALAPAGSAPLRRLCGDTMLARFDAAGALGKVTLDGSVDYQDGELGASADRLEGQPDESLRLTGQPVRVGSDRGAVEAPEIVYSRAAGRLQASGGVRASEQGRSGVELAAAGERAPVMVTATEAVWSREPAQSVFTGNVRAWQGDSFLLADRLATSNDGAHLEALGSVRSVWRPAPDAPAERQPVAIDAGSMTYLRSQQQLRYQQAVRVHEAGRTLRCDDLELAIDDQSRIESMLCQGNTLIDDPVGGRSVRGNEALYTPADGQMLISGQPVVLQEQDGTQMRGRRLRYDLDSGEVSILSEPRAPREPEDAPIRDDG